MPRLSPGVSTCLIYCSAAVFLLLGLGARIAFNKFFTFRVPGIEDYLLSGLRQGVTSSCRGISQYHRPCNWESGEFGDCSRKMNPAQRSPTVEQRAHSDENAYGLGLCGDYTSYQSDRTREDVDELEET